MRGTSLSSKSTAMCHSCPAEVGCIPIQTWLHCQDWWAHTHSKKVTRDSFLKHFLGRAGQALELVWKWREQLEREWELVVLVFVMGRGAGWGLHDLNFHPCYEREHTGSRVGLPRCGAEGEGGDGAWTLLAIKRQTWSQTLYYSICCYVFIIDPI